MSCHQSFMPFLYMLFPQGRVGLGSLLPFQGLTWWAGAKHSPSSAPLAPTLQTKGSKDDPKHRGHCPSFPSTKALCVGGHSSCCRVFPRSVVIPIMLSGATFIRLSTTDIWGHILSLIGLVRAGSPLQASQPIEPAVTQLEGHGGCSGLDRLPDVRTSPSSWHAALERRLPADMGLLLRQLANEFLLMT